MGLGSKYITTEELCRLVKISRLRAFFIGSVRAIKMTNGANGEWLFDEDDARRYFNLPRKPKEEVHVSVTSPATVTAELSPTVANTIKPHAITLDAHQEKALNMISEGDNLFITGKAGTGKTVLLNKIRAILKGKKYVVTVAPTGVAAEHANGFTMHSFFRLPMKAYLPGYEVKPDCASMSCANSIV